jgi:hypothetical protein
VSIQPASAGVAEEVILGMEFPPCLVPTATDAISGLDLRGDHAQSCSPNGRAECQCVREV